jgi:hypothetical protein
MSYTINRYNGTLITAVADGTVDATLDLKLIGKNYAGYGAIQNENFVYLLENFANSIQPPRPIQGQIWFDTGNNKLKFYDGTKFRSAGGSETSATAPSGLTTGDFWFDNVNQQLYAYNGSTFTLIGPQAVSGSGTTQMRSVSLVDTNGASHAVIEAVDNGQIVFVISSDGEFTLDTTINPITGFTKIHQGVTLVNTNNDSQPGITSTSHRFWGTATNAEKLGGLPASNFVQSGSANFNAQVNFGDPGFTVGNPVARLAVYNSGALTPTIQNQINDTIQFQTTVSSTTKTPLKLVGNDVVPGFTLTSNLGTSALLWNNVYANYVYSTVAKADTLSVGGNYVSASLLSTPSSIAARDSSGNLTAANFNGTATSAYYADLAEKYLPDADYEVGTVMMIGGEKEVTAAGFGSFPIGVISDKPAFKMNEGLVGGVYVALKGRVPVKVIGPVAKGDQMMASGSGYARSDATQCGNRIFAIALEDNSDEGVKTVECLVL